MGLEVATYINGLVISNPAGTDDRSQGDDHIRMIKSVLKNTFPNITGPINLTQDQINAVLGNLVPVGIITMWSGAVANIPSGWKLCNGVGTISNGSPVPNLVSRFIIGSETNAGGNYNIGQTGGASSVTPSGVVGDTSLTVDQIPAHSHTIPVHSGNWGYYGNTPWGSHGNNTTTVSGSVGGGKAHSHTFTATPISTIPPYYALAFIIKD